MSKVGGHFSLRYCPLHFRLIISIARCKLRIALANHGKEELKLSRKSFWLIALLASLVLSLAAIRSVGSKALVRPRTSFGSRDRLASLPPIILWAWERPEKLDFIDPREIGVAYLSQTLYLRGERVVARPRMQPLNVPEGTTLIAVTRIESDRSEPPSLSHEQITRAVSEIADRARLPHVVAVQVDFDATKSERNFYRDLLLGLRGELPDSTGLSITALASWCKRDDWLSEVPLDEAVPMLFRMGLERRQILSQLASGENFNSTPCGSSSGISTDEPLSYVPSSQHLYIFNPRPWTQTDVQKVMENYQR